MQELGIRNEVVQAVLNHAVPGVGGVYLRSRTRKAEGRRAGDMGHGAYPHRRAGAGDGMTVRKKVKKTASKTVSDNARLLEIGRSLAATHARYLAHMLEKFGAKASSLLLPEGDERFKRYDLYRPRPYSAYAG